MILSDAAAVSVALLQVGLILGAVSSRFLSAPASGEPAGPPALAKTEQKQEAVPALNGQKEDFPPTKAHSKKVRVSRPLVREVNDYVVLSGHIDPVMSIDLRARVGGILNRTTCQLGQAVKKGDLLFEIDPRPYKAELDQAEAEIRVAEARLKVRMTELAEAQGDSQERESRRRASRIKSQCEEAEAAVQAARKAWDLIKLKIDYSIVLAPIDGTIIGSVLTPGNIVVADATSLATLISTEPMYVYFEVDQETVVSLKRLRREGKLPGGAGGAVTVRVGLRDEPDFPRAGRVDSVDGPLDPATGAARWCAKIPNPDGLLLPGMAAGVRLVTSPAYKAFLVTDFAPPLWTTSDDDWLVFVVNDQNVVQKRLVKRGSQQGGLRVVKEGIRAEDWVVIDSADEGTKVDPERVPMPTEYASAPPRIR
jgi:RND family efflux transporter MFP subunit